MSVDHNVYLGPYIACVYQPVERMNQVYFCSQTEGLQLPDPRGRGTAHRVTSSDKFCSQCGSSISTKMVATGKFNSNVDQGALRQAINERLYEASSMGGGEFGAPNTEYWLSNVRDTITRQTKLDSYEETALSITPELIQAEIQCLEKFFSKEIEILKQHYKSVQVVWGLLAYCN